MIKAIVRKTDNHSSNYEVYLPATAAVDGKRIRKRFKRKADATHEML